jgi:CRISPR-associated protein Cmr2
MSTSLLKLQIGPVQEFIAQARSTRDLWSGSYLLSWLMAAGLNELVSLMPEGSGSALERAEEAVIYPSLRGQPLCHFRRDPANRGENAASYLTPSLPNLFLAVLPVSASEAGAIGKNVGAAMEEEWKRIANWCWMDLDGAGLVAGRFKGKFDHQVDRWLSVFWQATPWLGDYVKSREENARQLDAVRRTRSFRAWAVGGWSVGREQNKDSLTGREEAICGGEEWWNSSCAGNSKWVALFPEKHAGEHFGAITLVKRVWHDIYLGSAPWNLRVTKTLPIPSTWAVAAHVLGKDESNETDGTSDGGHFAVLAMDGDKMGERVGKAREKAAQQSLSARLGLFAQGPAGAVVRDHHGFVIYAGGDDVLALVPGDEALECAKALRAKFREVVGDLDLDASAGIAVAHPKSPLQDVVRAAQQAERRAKRGLQRRAVAVTLLKRSGGLTEWGCKWDSRGLELLDALVKAVNDKKLSAKAPYRLIELLAPYVSQSTPLIREGGKARDDERFSAAVEEIVKREFETVLDRQGTYGSSDAPQRAEILSLLDEYLDSLSKEPLQPAPAESVSNKKAQRALAAMIGLCDVAAFTNRTASPETPPGQSQPA